MKTIKEMIITGTTKVGTVLVLGALLFAWGMIFVFFCKITSPISDEEIETIRKENLAAVGQFVNGQDVIKAEVSSMSIFHCPKLTITIQTENGIETKAFDNVSVDTYDSIDDKYHITVNEHNVSVYTPSTYYTDEGLNYSSN